MLAVSVLGMVTVRHTVRLLNLAGHYDPASYTVKPQWPVFFIFLACFLVAIAAIAYMLKLYFAGETAGKTG